MSKTGFIQSNHFNKIYIEGDFLFIEANATTLKLRNYANSSYRYLDIGGLYFRGIEIMSSMGGTDHFILGTPTKVPQITKLTTVERDALAPVDAMLIFNTTTNQFEIYQDTTWKSLVTKELFKPAINDTGVMTTIGDHKIPVLTGNSGDICHIQSFFLPHDYHSAIGGGVVIIPIANGNIRLETDSDMGANGEAYNTHSDHVNIDADGVTQNQIIEVPTSALTNALANDYVGIKVSERNIAGMQDFGVLGFRFRYV